VTSSYSTDSLEQVDVRYEDPLTSSDRFPRDLDALFAQAQQGVDPERLIPRPATAMTNRKSALLDTGWQDVQRKTFTKW